MLFQLPNGCVIDSDFLVIMEPRDEVLAMDSPDGKEHPPSLTLAFEIGGHFVGRVVELNDVKQAYFLRDAIIKACDLPVTLIKNPGNPSAKKDDS